MRLSLLLGRTTLLKTLPSSSSNTVSMSTPTAGMRTQLTRPGVWRDKLAFTWDYRTFNFRDAIKRAATDLFQATGAKVAGLLNPAPALQRPYPDIAFVQFTLDFNTKLVNAYAVINAVYTKEGWKIWTMHTVAENLLDFPEVPPADGHMTGPSSWEVQRAAADDAVQPQVVIVGGGQK